MSQTTEDGYKDRASPLLHCYSFLLFTNGDFASVIISFSFSSLLDLLLFKYIFTQSLFNLLIYLLFNIENHLHIQLIIWLYHIFNACRILQVLLSIFIGLLVVTLGRSKSRSAISLDETTTKSNLYKSSIHSISIVLTIRYTPVFYLFGVKLSFVGVTCDLLGVECCDPIGFYILLGVRFPYDLLCTANQSNLYKSSIALVLF